MYVSYTPYVHHTLSYCIFLVRIIYGTRIHYLYIKHGSYYFMSLETGKRLNCYQWNELPITSEVIDRVNFLSTKEKQQQLQDGMPLFEWEPGVQINNTEMEVDSNVESKLTDNDETTKISEEDINYDEENGKRDELPIEDVTTYDEFNDISNLEDDDDEESHYDTTINENDYTRVYSSDDEPSVDKEHTTVNDIQDQDQDTLLDMAPVSVQNTDVEPDISNVEAVTNENNNVATRSDEVTENNHPRHNLRKNRKPDFARHIGKINKANDFSFLHNKHKKVSWEEKECEWSKDIFKNIQDIMLTQMKNGTNHEHDNHEHDNDFQEMVNFVFTQMSAYKSMKLFGEEAVAALFKEYTQLHNKKVFEPIKHIDLTVQNKLDALNAINLIKVKRDRVIKRRTCANGNKQKRYVSKKKYPHQR